MHIKMHLTWTDIYFVNWRRKLRTETVSDLSNLDQMCADNVDVIESIKKTIRF